MPDGGIQREGWTRERWAVTALAAIMLAAVAVSSAEVPAGSLCPGVPARPPSALSPIEHIFFVIKENHALENYFGDLPGVRGYPPNGSFPVAFGSNETIAPFPLAGSSTPGFPNDQASELVDRNGGRNNLFVAEAAAEGAAAPQDAVGYYTARQIPDYYTYARQYLLDDEFFTGVLGPTLPNRLFDLGLTSTQWSSDVPPSSGTLSGWTVLDQLQAAGLPWGYYYSGSGVGDVPNYLPQFSAGSCSGAHILPVADLGAALSGPSPPALAYIDPSSDTVYSEHPPANVTLGEEWTVALLNEIFESPVGATSAVFLFYDEAGGFWDPANPPAEPPQGDGFRVPLLVLSPWTPVGVISHEVLDPAALLRFVDENWGLPPLNSRVAAAPSIAADFDFGAVPRSPVLLSTPVSLASAVTPANSPPAETEVPISPAEYQAVPIFRSVVASSERGSPPGPVREGRRSESSNPTKVRC
jgi:phospholipase C